MADEVTYLGALCASHGKRHGAGDITSARNRNSRPETKEQMFDTRVNSAWACASGFSKLWMHVISYYSIHYLFLILILLIIYLFNSFCPVTL
jgi:hypothetical protein